MASFCQGEYEEIQYVVRDYACILNDFIGIT